VKTCPVSLKLEMPVIRELLSREEIQVAEAPADSPAMATGEATVKFLSACCRLMDLLDTPQDVPFLSGLIQREIKQLRLQAAREPCSSTVWTPRVRPLRSDTRVQANSTANTVALSANPPCGTFGLSARQALCPWSRSVIGKALPDRLLTSHGESKHSE
jgi:hypothetical protein